MTLKTLAAFLRITCPGIEKIGEYSEGKDLIFSIVRLFNWAGFFKLVF